MFSEPPANPTIMKLQPTSMACITAILAMQVSHAIQPPADDSPPPPSLDVAEMPPAPRDMPDARDRIVEAPPIPRVDEAEQPGFLGISVAQIPEMLGAHLDIPGDQGVLVRVVSPGSAADKVGMRLYDVILKVAGKPVASHEDVSGRVAEHRAGDKIEIEFVRKGRAQTVEAVLDPRPANIQPVPGIDRGIGELRLGLDDLFFEELPQDQAGRIRDMIERNLRALGEPGPLQEDELFQDAFRDMREQMQRMLAEPKPFAPLDENGGFGKIQMNAGATVRLMDDEGSIELKAVDDSKEVTVRDRDNEIVWTGPWDTEQDKAAAPDDIRERIERLNIEGFQQCNGLRLQFFRNR